MPLNQIGRRLRKASRIRIAQLALDKLEAGYPLALVLDDIAIAYPVRQEYIYAVRLFERMGGEDR